MQGSSSARNNQIQGNLPARCPFPRKDEPPTLWQHLYLTWLQREQPELVKPLHHTQLKSAPSHGTKTKSGTSGKCHTSPKHPPAECWLGKGTFGVETCLLLFHLIFWEVWVLISLFFLESKSSIESHLWSWKVLYCLNVAGADVPAAFLGEVVHSLRKKLEWSFIQKSLLRSSSS